MKYSMKFRFWLWVERWAGNIFYYARDKNERVGYRLVYGKDLDTSSNTYNGD